MRYTQTTFVFVLQPCSEKRNAVSVCGRFPYLQGTAVRYRVLTVVLRIAAYWFFQNGEMRSQESNYMYSSFTKSTIKNQNTQLTEKSVGITIRIFPDYPIEKSQYPINKKISVYYPIHQNFLSGALCQVNSRFSIHVLQGCIHILGFLINNILKRLRLIGGFSQIRDKVANMPRKTFFLLKLCSPCMVCHI